MRNDTVGAVLVKPWKCLILQEVILRISVVNNCQLLPHQIFSSKLVHLTEIIAILCYLIPFSCGSLLELDRLQTLFSCRCTINGKFLGVYLKFPQFVSYFAKRKTGLTPASKAKMIYAMSSTWTIGWDCHSQDLNKISEKLPELLSFCSES